MDVQTNLVLPPLFKLRDDVGDLTELKGSIRDQGQLIPIIVRQEGEKYRLIDGHRRWTATLELGLPTIKVDVIEASNEKALVAALISNMERKTMDPIEEAKAFNLYISEKGYGSAVELARKISRSEAYISHTLDLLKLPDNTLELIKSKELSASHGKELARLDTDKATELGEFAVKAELSKDQTQKAVSFVKGGMSVPQAVHTVVNNPDVRVPKDITKFDAVKMARNNVVLTLEKALKNIDFYLGDLGESPEHGVWVREVRFPTHELINKALKLQKEYDS